MANQRHIKGAKIPDDMDVAAIRLNTTCPGQSMPYTQENFARLLGVPTGTLPAMGARAPEAHGGGSGSVFADSAQPAPRDRNAPRKIGLTLRARTRAIRV